MDKQNHRSGGSPSNIKLRSKRLMSPAHQGTSVLATLDTRLTDSTSTQNVPKKIANHKPQKKLEPGGKENNGDGGHGKFE